MATKQNITAFKGEQLVIDLVLQDEGGNPVTEPAGYTVTLAISTSAGGAPIVSALTFDLVEPEDARFRRVLSPEDLAAVSEERIHYYNVWAAEGSATPALRAYGTLRLRGSIEVPS
jgi:hypothetical protein